MQCVAPYKMTAPEPYDVSRILYFSFKLKLKLLIMSHNGLHADWIKSINLKDP